MTPAPGGFALRCDREGRIQSVIRDEGGLMAAVAPGTLFPTLIERGCRGKAFDFLVEIREKGIAFDRELTVVASPGDVSLHFTGSRVGEGILIVASMAMEGTGAAIDELVRISSEQATLIRSLRKECLDTAANSGGGGAALEDSPSNIAADPLFDEISRLNNELVNAQRELTRKNAELARLDGLKNRFMGMAAHDLRSPLSVCITYANLLLEDDIEDAAMRKDWLGTMLERMEFMLELVEDLLDTAAIESGMLRLDTKLADVEQLSLGMLETNRLLARKRGVDIVQVGDRGPRRAMVDPVRIEQVLNNLLSNAVKFSLSGSTVEFSIGEDSGSIVIAIADHGQGMDRAQLEGLFTPFGSPTVRTAGGEKNTGLGLLIARRIAEAHGGSLAIESETGKGTRVELRIPALARTEMA